MIRRSPRAARGRSRCARAGSKAERDAAPSPQRVRRLGCVPRRRTRPSPLRFALREMRGGLSGFLIFLTCIALGVAAIGGVDSVARAITAGVAKEGQTLLGGDMRFELNQREATPQERAFLDGLGAVAVSADMRSMARLEDGSDQALVEVKAVDGAYPLYGAAGDRAGAAPGSDFSRERDGVYGAAAPDLLVRAAGSCRRRPDQARQRDFRTARQTRLRARRDFRRFRLRAAAAGLAGRACALPV